MMLEQRTGRLAKQQASLQDEAAPRLDAAGKSLAQEEAQREQVFQARRRHTWSRSPLLNAARQKLTREDAARRYRLRRQGRRRTARGAAGVGARNRPLWQRSAAGWQPTRKRSKNEPRG